MVLLPLVASAETVEIDGIYYNLYSDAKTAEVTSSNPKYSGDVVIPETVSYNAVQYSVTSIGYKAFYGCNGLTSITIPNSVTSIGDYAFYYCYSLAVVISLNPTPPTTSKYGSFYSYTATLKVPIGSKDAYSAAENWKNFTNIEEIDVTGIKTVLQDQHSAAPVYDLNGHRLSTPKKGINIIGGKKMVVK